VIIITTEKYIGIEKMKFLTTWYMAYGLSWSCKIKADSSRLNVFPIKLKSSELINGVYVCSSPFMHESFLHGCFYIASSFR